MKQILVLTFLLTSAQLIAQEIKDFALVNTKDGKTISLSGIKSPGIAVIFTSHECPFDNYYKERLKALVSQYSGKIQFLFINSNQEPQESADQMAIHYKDVDAPYLADKDQVVMELFGARKSPEVFLVSTASGKFNVVYSGAIDDNPQVAQDVKVHFLKDALDKLLAGQKIEVPTQRASGCTIRRK